MVFAGGDVPAPTELAGLEGCGLVVAADSGFDHARALGFACGVLVGDMDSLSPEGLAAAEESGIEIVRHPVDKEHTDLELALEEARGRGATCIVVVGLAGGRVDHFLANVAVLGAASLAEVDIEARMKGASLLVVRKRRSIDAPVGSLISLMAVGGPAREVFTSGFRWELDHETLLPASGRGISNVVAKSPATVTLSEGLLLVIQPGPPTA